MSDRRLHFRADSGAVRLRAAEGEARTLVGHAAVFDTWTVLYRSKSYVYREIIRPGAFARALREGQNVVANFNHSDDMVLGRSTSKTLRLSEDQVGLACEIDVPDTTLGRDVLTLVTRGDVSGMSFAFRPSPDGGERTTIESQDGVDVVSIEILDVDLYDVSVVTWPAYPSTDLSVRADRLIADHRAEARDRWCRERRARLKDVASRVRA